MTRLSISPLIKWKWNDNSINGSELSNVRDNHKHVGSIIGPKTYMMIVNLIIKTTLTIDDLMTMKKQGLLRKNEANELLITIRTRLD